jgi:hypothetical protein
MEEKELEDMMIPTHNIKDLIRTRNHLADQDLGTLEVDQEKVEVVVGVAAVTVADLITITIITRTEIIIINLENRDKILGDLKIEVGLAEVVVRETTNQSTTRKTHPLLPINIIVEEKEDLEINPNSKEEDPMKEEVEATAIKEIETQVQISSQEK